MKSFIILCLFVCLASRAESIHFRKCQRNDPNINMCIANLVNSLKPYLKRGVAEIDLPVMDPYQIPTLYGNTKLDGDDVEVLFLKSNIIGGSTFTIDSMNLTSSHVDLKVRFPKIDISAEFRAEDLWNRDRATGKLAGKFENLVVAGQIYASRNKHNPEHLKLDSIKMAVTIGQAKLTGSVNESSRIGRLILQACGNPNAALQAHQQLINQNTETIFKALIEKILAREPISAFLK